MEELYKTKKTASKAEATNFAEKIVKQKATHVLYSSFFPFVLMPVLPTYSYTVWKNEKFSLTEKYFVKSTQNQVMP